MSALTQPLRALAGVTGIVAAVAAAVLGLALAGPAASGSAPRATDEPDAAFTVDDAVFRWGVNDESNNRAFAPGTFNFLSAGRVPDPGRGGQTIVEGNWRETGVRAWRASAGEVSIEKVTTAGAQPATWAGLSTGPGGEPIGSPTSGIFSGHQVVITGGRGTVDPAAGTATIRWKGSFSVVYYSGMTFFVATDPVLTVTPRGARVTATASGYASSMDDQTVWEPVPSRTITLADLTGVDGADLAAEAGFTADVRYLGRTFVATGDEPQQQGGAYKGAFPASFLAFMRTVGMTPYWYSSGGSADPHKVPHPVVVSWDARTPLEPETPGPTTTTPTDEPTNPPGEEPPTAVPTQPAGPGLPDPTQPAGPALPTGTDATDAAPGAPYQPPTVYALAADAPTAEANGASATREWVLGGVLLLAAAGVTCAGALNLGAVPASAASRAAARRRRTSSPPSPPPVPEREGHP